MSLVDGVDLLSAQQLAACIDDPSTRVFDCSVELVRGEPGGGSPYRVVSGRDGWLQARLPNAAFLDLPGTLSDPDAATGFMRLPAATQAERFAAAGVVDGARIVLYARSHPMWATRVWWMLRALGVHAAVLDGGLAGWRAADLPVASGPFDYEAGSLTVEEHRTLWADADDVADHGGCTLNALSPAMFRGEAPYDYGRRGRIPGSANLPYATLLAENGQHFASAAQAEAAVAGEADE